MKSFFSKLLVVLTISFLSFSGLSAQAVGDDSLQYNLRIEGTNKTYFDGKIIAGDCTIIDSEGKPHQFTLSAICGVSEASKISNFDYVFDNSSWGLFLKRIDTTIPSDDSKYWAFWLNDDSASFGIDAYSPKQNDFILLAYSGFDGTPPLRVVLPEEIQTNKEFAIKTEKRVGTTDENWVWHGTWEPASGAKLHINDISLDIPDNGELKVTLLNEKNSIWAEGSNLIRSSKTSVDFSEPTPKPTATPSPTPTPSPSPTIEPTPEPTTSPTPSVSSEKRSEKATLALSFLKSKQGDDGFIEGTTATIWSVIAFGANENRAEEIKHDDTSLLDALALNDPESATDLERLIIALRATGQNPHSFNDIDYVQQLKNKFKNNQFGEESLINDDIFGILALLSANEAVNSNMMHNSVEALLKKQGSNGLWENIDLTSAAIQALTAYKKSGGNINADDSIAQARNALKNNQDKFGGFGENSATTSWSIQAIVSLGEDPSDWKLSNGNNPWTALLSYQNSNGGFGWKTKDDVSAFMTSYAISALLKSPWPIAKLKIQNNYKSSVVNTVSPTPSATPSPTPSTKPSPILTTQKSTTKSYTNKTVGSVAGAETSPTPLPVTTANPVIANISSNEDSAKNNPKSLVLELGFANIGIGMTIASVIRKIRLFV